jgi:hypothetical protein
MKRHVNTVNTAFIVVIRESGQRDAQFFHSFIPIKLSSAHFEQITVHHQEVISVHAACSISHASVGCLAANTM